MSSAVDKAKETMAILETIGFNAQTYTRGDETARSETHNLLSNHGNGESPPPRGTIGAFVGGNKKVEKFHVNSGPGHVPSVVQGNFNAGDKTFGNVVPKEDTQAGVATSRVSQRDEPDGSSVAIDIDPKAEKSEVAASSNLMRNFTKSYILYAIIAIVCLAGIVAVVYLLVASGAEHAEFDLDIPRGRLNFKANNSRSNNNSSVNQVVVN